MAIGETSAIESGDKSKIQDLATRVKDLNARLNDIRREQVFQRVRVSIIILPQPLLSLFIIVGILLTVFVSKQKQEREAEFRDQSESTNARVIRWILIQLTVLGISCAWQLSHLRSFFIKQKLT